MVLVPVALGCSLGCWDPRVGGAPAASQPLWQEVCPGAGGYFQVGRGLLDRPKGSRRLLAAALHDVTFVRKGFRGAFL